MINQQGPKPKPIKIVVERVACHPERGTCHCHQEGQEFTFDFERCPADFCAAAFHSLWPHLRVLELGGRHPWDAEEGVTFVACPDPNKPVVFKIIASEK
ncbi:TIGR04076 family protein [Moorella naiadis]|uniref:TIGR04076 family protein n=1 Tax=Moorella naiadis (nom. illeg.) TaxID=3093670 RepID=UPI003D9CA7D1